MTVQPDDVYELLRKIRYDLTAAQAKLTDAFNALNALNLPTNPATECPHCGLDFPGQHTLAEHVFNSHGGPVPEHQLELDERVARAQTLRLRAMVEQGGYAIEADELERQLRLYGVDDEDELVGLLELAADLRRGVSA